MVAKRKADLLSDTSLRSSFGEGGFTCYSEEVFDGSLLTSGVSS